MSDTANWRDLFPFESRYLDLNGRRMHYVDEGRGSPVLMVHGNPTWSFHFRELIRALRSSHRAVAVDHLGCGLSEAPDTGRDRLRDHIDRLVAFVRRLDLDEITIVAHDWGGAISLGMALAERPRIARIVLLNTGAWPPETIPRRIAVCRVPVLGQLAVQGGNFFLLAAFRMALVHRERMTPAVRAGYLAPYHDWNSRRAIYRFVRDIPPGRRHPTYETLAQIERGLPQLADLPIQLIWGMQDWCFTPACLERFVTYFPRASVLRIADAGHWVLEDSPGQVVRGVLG
jgi:haloalkane dehalogenase